MKYIFEKAGIEIEKTEKGYTAYFKRDDMLAEMEYDTYCWQFKHPFFGTSFIFYPPSPWNNTVSIDILVPQTLDKITTQ